MFLDSTSKSLQIVLNSAVTTNQLPWVASWADISGSTITPGSSDNVTNGTTAVTLVAAPGSGVQRQVKTVNVYNADTAPIGVTVSYNDGSNMRTLLAVSMSPGETLQYDGSAWSVINANGNQLSTVSYTPGGAAGGDLSGSYPNPTVAKLNGIAAPTTAPTTGQVLTATSSTATAWQTGSTSGYAPLAGATFTGAISPAVVVLSDGSSISVNAALGNVFTVTLGGNRTLANPTNPTDGQFIRFLVTQDSTGSRTLSFGTAYDFSTSLPSPTLSTAAGTTDVLGFHYSATMSKWLFIAFVNGFS